MKTTSDDIDRLLDEAVIRGSIPGVVAMALDREGVLYSHATGHRELAADVVMTEDTIFRIASMTKAVTSVAVLQLVERGDVELDATASTYVPRLAKTKVIDGWDADGPLLREPKSPITVRQLLTHTSGHSYEMWNEQLYTLVSTGRLKSLAHGTTSFLDAPLIADPGTTWSYGIGTDLLGELVERVAYTTLDLYFEEHILGPLGMKDTHFIVPESKHPRITNQFHRLEDMTLREADRFPPAAVTFLSGGAGLYSTAADYARFVRMILRGGELDGVRILESTTVDEMGRNQIGELEAGAMKTSGELFSNDVDFHPGSADKFGLGFLLNAEPVPGGRAAGSLEWAGIFNSYYWIDRSNEIAGVILLQVMPFFDGPSLDVYRRFEQSVYSTFSSPSTSSR